MQRKRARPLFTVEARISFSFSGGGSDAEEGEEDFHPTETSFSSLIFQVQGRERLPLPPTFASISRVLPSFQPLKVS